jgi:hypothetical protein
MDNLDTRIARIAERASELIDRLAKAKGGKRIPGDGDGDGIPNEGRRGKGGGRKMVNVGTAKWPVNVPKAGAMPRMDSHGFTHKVPGFKPPRHANSQKPEGGDHDFAIGSTRLSWSGKTGTHARTGQKSYEYQDVNNSGTRYWVAADGRAYKD